MFPSPSKDVTCVKFVIPESTTCGLIIPKQNGVLFDTSDFEIENGHADTGALIQKVFSPNLVIVF